MADDSGQMKVDWKIGKGNIPNGPDFSNTTGTINLDSFGWDQISVVKGDHEKTLTINKPLEQATIVLIRALPGDNNGADIYKYLSYKFGNEGWTYFDNSPLMLIGSVAKKFFHGKGQQITIRYDPDRTVNSDEGAGKAATTPQPPNKAIVSILVGIDSSLSDDETQANKNEQS